MSDTVSAQTLRLIGYFPAGAIHAQNYHIADIPAGLLSHVIYAFANVTAAGRNVSTTLRQPAFEFKLGFSAFGLAG